MATTNLSILIDKGLKEEAEEVYKELGLTLSEAICLFLRATVTEHGLPFALKLDSLAKAPLRPSRREGGF